MFSSSWIAKSVLILLMEFGTLPRIFFQRHQDIVNDILRITAHITDLRIWPSSASGNLTSRHAYEFLRSPLLRMSWASWIWAPFIPQIRNTVVWRASWDKLPTTDRFQQIGLQGPSICHLCMADSEIQDHILSECRFTRSLLSSIFDIFNVHICYDFGFSSILIQVRTISLRSK